jgi:hypothetical protein
MEGLNQLLSFNAITRRMYHAYVDLCEAPMSLEEFQSFKAIVSTFEEVLTEVKEN